MTLPPGTTLGPYEIVGFIGAGGMGEVYRARDPRLKRDVAIKLIPPALATDPDRLRRFEQEAQAIAALTHPNILAIYDIGTVPARQDSKEQPPAGARYLVTELLTGATLRTLLSRGPLPVQRALDIGRSIAQALAAAHAKHIVHRDLKPENLFITDDGRVKILDFGLAKLLDIPEPTETTAVGTQSGMVLGTMGYMAPEQVRGQSVDHRADIFAFGAVLYEMLTARRAFQRDTWPDTMSAILNAEPPELPPLIKTEAAGLDRVIRVCLAKAPTDRFQSAADVVLALDALGDASGAPPLQPVASMTPRRRVLIAGAVGALVGGLAGGGWWIARHDGSSRSGSVDPQDARRTVAVLPFKNVSADAAQNYFSAGMTEEIRGQLSKLSALRLLSRSAVERYGEADVRRMAQELGAGSVVEGSVRLDKQRVRIGVQLIDAQNEQLLWAEQYDRELHDIFAVQSDVALRIAGALQATLSPDERRRVEKRPTENFAAYELYLKSQPLPISEREPNLQAIQMLRQALELDPKFAVGQARIAYRTMFLAYYDDARNLDLAIELARKAITLDPTLADGHFALASAYGQKGQVANARLSFLRAMELNPNAAGSMHNLSIFELDVGRYDESLAWARRAFRLAPNGFLSYYHVGVPLIWLGDDEVSHRWLSEADRRFPHTPRIMNLMAVLKWLRGDQRGAVAAARTLVEAVPKDEEALSLLDELIYLEGTPDAELHAERSFQTSPDITATLNLVPESPRARYAHLLVRRGNTSAGAPLMEEALTLAKKALEEDNQSSRVPMEIAAIHATRRETQPALEWLQRGYDAGWRDYRTLGRDPMFADLRRERRFEALVKRMEADVAEMRRRANVREVLELLTITSAPSTAR